mgnify:CR=1 FL=1|jgi:hypothetical protein
MSRTFLDLKREKIIGWMGKIKSTTTISHIVSYLKAMKVSGIECYHFEKVRKVENYDIEKLNSYLDYKSQSETRGSCEEKFDVDSLTLGDMLSEKNTPYKEIELEEVKLAGL